ncbi:MAG: sugar ABC transporter permease [bacterium]|nr:sugar ABC transporter permease [Candidatus Sumerlaeota bacterium]
MRRYERWGYLFVSPWLLGFLAFTAFPIACSLYLSLCRWELISPNVTFVGMANYRQIVAADPQFWNALRATVSYVAGAAPLVMFASLGVALLLNLDIPGMRLFRTIFFLPALLSGTAFCFLWLNVFDPQNGLLNSALAPIFNLLGIPLASLPKWIYSKDWALFSMVLMSLWGIGPGMIVFLVGLRNIPVELIEAALVDGAGCWRRFIHITFPMITPAVLFNLITGLIAGFQVFLPAFVLTRGGPQDSTLFYALYIWQVAFEQFRAGYASALAWILFLVILLLTLVSFGLSRRWVYYES